MEGRDTDEEPVDPYLCELIADTNAEAEEVYNTIHEMFASVEKNWIIERAGHGSDTLAAFIATYEGLIPKEATAREYGHNNKILDKDIESNSSINYSNSCAPTWITAIWQRCVEAVNYVIMTVLPCLCIKDIREEEEELIEKHTCPVCFDDFSSLDVMTCTGFQPDDHTGLSPNCQSHFLCLECMKRHAEHVVVNEPLTSSNGQGIRCVEPNCKNIILTSRFEHMLDERAKKILADRLAQAALGEIDGIERCPKCNYAVFNEDSYEENKIFFCARCEFECCRRCQKEWDKHLGFSCAEAGALSEEEKRRRIEDKLSEAITLTCPRCKQKWAKQPNSGECNNMTCQCGCKFCNVCLEGDVDYDHFCNHTSSGNCAECDRACHLFEPDDEVEQKKREAAMKSHGH